MRRNTIRNTVNKFPRKDAFLPSGTSLSVFLTVLLILFRLPVYAQAQVYPVSVTTQLTPPYSVNLADYVAPGCEQLKVIIVQRDLTQAPYRLYLKMEIELNGRTIIRTSPYYIPPAFILEPGIPTLISGSSLAPFFDPVNMEFPGYSRDQYIRTKILPEGAYVITFTAYDWTRRDVALSYGGAFFCYLAKAEPPMLNLPFNNALVTYSSPQYINFQWLPGTTSSPNSAFSTKYRFELFEMRVGGISPSEMVTNTRPVFVTETDRTNLSYSIADPALEKGMRYVWRVKASDIQGRDYIRNNGMSEVFSFVYGEGEGGVLDFSEIGNFTAVALSPRKAKLTWDASEGYDSYRIYYRKQGKDNKWYETETAQNNAEINGLSPGTIYECRVQGKKMNAWGSFSITDTVLLPKIPVIECGSPFTPLDVTNREPLLELMKLQEFDAGGFMVTVIDPYALTTEPGRFTGRGFVQVPLFGHMKIRCEFTDIFLNNDFRMVDGSIRLICDHADGKNAIWDIDEEFEGGGDNGTVINGTEEVAVMIPDVVIVRQESVMLDTARNEILVVVESQDTLRINVAEKLKENPGSLTVQDSEGNLYSVDTKTGKATSLGKVPPPGSPQQLATPLPQVIDDRKGKVIFAPAPGQRFAFDQRSTQYARSNLFMEEYKIMDTEDGGLYDIPYKLIPVGETDVVLARAELKGNTIKSDSIVFRSGTGTIYKTQPSGKKDEFLLTLPSGKDNDGIDVYATYTDSKKKTYVLGKLIVMSYSVKRPVLTLVPVNGNGTDIDPAAVKAELDKIYQPVGVEWQVNLDEDFETTVDSLDINGSGLFSMYTEGMKKLNNEFVMSKEESFNASAVYLFLLRHSEDGMATGDMPRSKQFGYIFTETANKGGESAFYRTIAHEIAHGAFSLSHTFDEKYTIPEKTTTNLLDYTAGTDLVKHQWDAIHDPGLVIGMFERDEEGMMRIPITKFIEFNDLGIDFSAFVCDIPGKLTFITPAGYPIVLPNRYKFCFSGTTTKNELDNAVPLGVLTAFKDDANETFVSSFINYEGKWKFTGYKQKGSTQNSPFPYPESEVKILPKPTKLIVGVEDEINCKVNLAFITFTYNGSQDLNQPLLVNSNFNYKNFDPEITNSYDIESCRLPAKISSLTQAKCSELFASEDWVKYNVYGDNGVLIKYNLDGRDFYVYSNVDNQGASYYYTYDNVMQKWRNYVPPKVEGVLNSLSFLLNPKVLGKAAKDGGHQSLDIMGMIPVIGEGFDVINGFWYLLEKEGGQAAMCFASTIPVAGWVTTGGKWVWKGARKYARTVATSTGVLELVELSDDAVEILTKKINDLNLPEELTTKLAVDLKANPELLQRLADNPELVESWQVLRNTGLKSDIKWLERVSEYRKAGFQVIEQGNEIKILTKGIEIAKISEDALHIKIPHGNGWAKQSNAADAINVLEEVTESKKVYKIGTLDVSETTGSQYWSPEDPLSFEKIEDYAEKYGVPVDRLKGDEKFIIVGKIGQAELLITRPSVPYGGSQGSGIEVVTRSGGVQMESFHVLNID